MTSITLSCEGFVVEANSEDPVEVQHDESKYSSTMSRYNSQSQQYLEEDSKRFGYSS
jgi:hypothetical protein